MRFELKIRLYLTTRIQRWSENFSILLLLLGLPSVNLFAGAVRGLPSVASDGLDRDMDLEKAQLSPSKIHF